MSRIPINKMTLLDYGFTACKSNRIFTCGDVSFEFGITSRAVVLHKIEKGFYFTLHPEVKYIDELNALYLDITGYNLPNLNH
jgi:hypothetical protein